MNHLIFIFGGIEMGTIVSVVCGIMIGIIIAATLIAVAFLELAKDCNTFEWSISREEIQLHWSKEDKET